MCAKAMRAASPRGRRHGFDESVSAVSCLNDAFTGVGDCVHQRTCMGCREVAYWNKEMQSPYGRVWEEKVAHAQRKLD